MLKIVLKLWVPSVILAAVAAAQNPSAPKSPSPSGSTKAKEATPEFAWPELAILDKFAGPWNVAESHYNSKGDVVGSAKGIEEGAWVLDRRVLRRTYTSGEEGKLYRAIGMLTWDPGQKAFKGSWFDNASATGPTIVSGAWEPSSNTMTFSLLSPLADGKTGEHKVTDRFLDDEHRIVTTFKVAGNQLEKVLEVQFSRAHPCPANVGIISELPQSGGSR